jgi:hypothetical protein
MSTRRFSFIRTALGLSVLAVTLAGCSASPGGEPDDDSLESSEQALTTLPELRCSYVTGDTTHYPGFTAKDVQIKSGGYTGTDAKVLAFQREIRAIGTASSWSVVQRPSGQWYALDVTKLSSSSVASVVRKYSTISPVWASLYTCTPQWGDYYLPPGTPRPYVPTKLAVYDPTGCGGGGCL